MNLVAKESVAAQDPQNPGVLILSRFAGSADELGDALIVNPFEDDAISDAMHIGLSMGLAERRARWQSLRAQVWENTASRYCSVFLSHLAGRDRTGRSPTFSVVTGHDGRDGGQRQAAGYW
jgi:trehalose 6-phosphate synthase